MIRSPIDKNILLLAIAFCSLCAADDWPTYRHDNSRSGVTAERLAPPLFLEWVFQPVHRPEPAWPDPKREKPRVRFDDAFYTSIADGLVYFASSSEGKVYALDAVSGQVRWEFLTGGAVRLAPSLWQGSLYFGSDDGYVYAVNAVTGKLRWKVRAGFKDRHIIGHGRMISVQPPRAGVVVDSGVAYFAGGIFPNEGAALTAVDAKTGRQLWRNGALGYKYQNMPHGGTQGFTGISPQGYLLASSERIYVPSARSVPAGFSRKDGRLLFWKGNVHHQGGSWALLAEDALYSEAPRLLPPEATTKYYESEKRPSLDGTRLSYDASRLMGRDTKTGADRFVAFPGQKIVVTRETSYVLNKGRVTALDRQAYAALGKQENDLIKQLMAHFWRYYRPSLDVKVFTRKQKGKKPLSEKDRKALEKAMARLQIGNAERAKLQAKMEEVKARIAARIKWRASTGCEKDIIFAGGMIYVCGKGKVKGIDASTGEVVWSGEVESTALGLAVSGGRLFVSCDDGRIYCFGKGTASSPKSVKQSLSPAPQDGQAALYVEMAEELIRRSGIRRGFCLVYGFNEGRLLCELAKRTELRIYGYDPDPSKVRAARRRLDAAGLLGVRANVFESELSRLPCPDQFANLVISERAMRGDLAGSARELLRTLRPYGGVALIGQTPSAASAFKTLENSAFREWLRGLPGVQFSQENGLWAKKVRGPLPRAGEWTHQYADSGNSSASADDLVRAPFRVRWFGRPGMARVVDRHQGAASPLFSNGMLFHQGINYLWGIDAYNGFIRWERAVPGALRANVRASCSNLCATRDSLFVGTGKNCLRLEAQTGKTLTTYATPEPLKGFWAWIATDKTRLFGSSGANQYDSREIFALDIKSGNLLWKFLTGRIKTSTLALSGGKVFFLDSQPAEAETQQVQSAPKPELAEEPPPPVPLPGQPYYPAGRVVADIRTLVALDSQTGRRLWRTPLNLTGMGKNITVIASQEKLLLFANMDGARFAVFSARDGTLLWEKKARYFRRPVVIGDIIYTLPYAYDLHSGKLKTRTNPITGGRIPFTWTKTYGCGAVSASKHSMFFRSGSLAYYDITQDIGVSNFGGLKPSCWISQIAAGGLWLAPEGSAGCTCSYSIRSTVALGPANPSDTLWASYVTGIPVKPVRHLAVNFGARGDRRDPAGRVWFAWPRPPSRIGLKLPLQTKISGGPGFFTNGQLADEITGTDKVWVYTSGCRGLSRCIIPIFDKGQGPGLFTVRLHFAEPDGAKPGERVFDIRLQGQTVQAGFDVVKSSGGRSRPVVKEFRQVKVTDNLVLELLPPGNGTASPRPPILSGIEVVREP